MTTMAKRILAGSAGLLLIIIVVWFGLCVRTQSQIARIARQLPVTSTSGQAASTVDIVHTRLTPGEMEEDDDMPRIIVTPNTGTVSIELHIPAGNYDHYNVDLITEEGRPVNRQERLRSGVNRGEESLTIYYRASLLENRNYVILMTGPQGEAVGKYLFRVKK